jgi:hypothetical protein
LRFRVLHKSLFGMQESAEEGTQIAAEQAQGARQSRIGRRTMVESCVPLSYQC